MKTVFEDFCDLESDMKFKMLIKVNKKWRMSESSEFLQIIKLLQTKALIHCVKHN